MDPKRIKLQSTEHDHNSKPEWVKQEDEFCLNQLKVRAQIRFKEKRTTPFDHILIQFSLARDLKLFNEFDDLGIKAAPLNPIKFISEMQKSDLETLKNDINELVNLEKEDVQRNFWNALIVVCDHEIWKQTNAQLPESARTGSL